VGFARVCVAEDGVDAEEAAEAVGTGSISGKACSTGGDGGLAAPDPLGHHLGLAAGRPSRARQPWPVARPVEPA